MARLFLGLDSSTQSLSAMVIDYDARRVVYEGSLNFDQSLPHCGTENGTLRDPDPRVVHAPPLMWAEALDVLLRKMRGDGVAFGALLAVAGAGQQHGSVYLNAQAESVFANLDPAKDLKTNLAGIFSRETSPIWMDSSTTTECQEIQESLGGIQSTAAATGSATFERFTGPQIRKFHQSQPREYGQTAQVALVSSFMASLLAGQIAPIDHGDGAGMNLMDIRTKHWHPGAVAATAPNLLEKLPALAEPWSVVGPVSSYFVKRYGFSPAAQALVWSGDNPNSVIGLGLIQEGMVAISLGTSDTYFGYMKTCRTDPQGEGHVFVAPTGDYLTLICFKNGSLAREKIRDAYGLDWNGFNQALASVPAGNHQRVLLPYFEPEIVPRVNQPGLHRFDLDESDAGANCRAIVEAQMISMRIHSEWMKVKPTRIYATGGASTNSAILQVMADVHDCPVQRSAIPNSAALGAALRAAHGYLVQAGESPAWPEVVTGFTDPIPGSEIKADPQAVRVYGPLVEKYAACEKKVSRS